MKILILSVTCKIVNSFCLRYLYIIAYIKNLLKMRNIDEIFAGSVKIYNINIAVCCQY